MTDFRQVTDLISVAPQISEEDIDRAAADGVKLIICNRPDGEEAGQPPLAELKAHAAAKGIPLVLIPIASGQFTLDAVQQMAASLKEADGEKVLAYCRSGTRSCVLWAMAEAYTKGLSTDELIERGAVAGYDLAPMAAMFENLRAMEA
ncbi:TIGR01244 family sulfur transferase [Gimibacter soli]|uniref:TIGR01244 family sulfur transferase n=1 Tax=Gimibacter soli TaxID=3024400 RepID=A0AAE9XTX6_9PROT|nr:TIGR01244 family sulfur transferase [Gimibacter soli]WCL54816.1 TIGR01244 family sulfur transferase [Gimibacter soli]